ncbi:MAG: AAA family ATPase, partial [Oscillospiraceae bacterium]|nr:AAA family ATPase [Oscillospiraceae bacterium]
VLTLLWLPRAAEKQQRVLLELLPEMTFVTLQEDLLDGEQARAFLARQAEKNSLAPDGALFAAIDSRPEERHWPEELRRIYEGWHGRQLKRVVYSQYAEFESARQQLGAASARGSAWDELQGMVGLAQAKAVMRQALDYFKAQKLFRSKGMHGARPAMHMAFTGSPGTAKTTAARLFARIMKENGLLAVGDLIEVGRGDLVGKYLGWTAQIVQRKFKQAKGSVLFIDEAYSLVDDKAGLYGDEAINTIVQEMENHREDVAVIFAGYSDKMEEFLRRNPGLRSRVAFHVPFDDYDADELLAILELMLKRDGMRLDAAARDLLEPHFARAKKAPDFGNGRYVRNLLEQAKMRQASRLLARDPDAVERADLELLLPEDLVFPQAETSGRKIGFALA